MKKLFKNPIYVYGILFYLYIFIGFVLYTDLFPVVLHKYSWHYVEGLLAVIVFGFVYYLLLVFLCNNSLDIIIGKRKRHIGVVFRLTVVVVVYCLIFLCTEVVLRMLPKPNLEDFHPFLQAINTKKNKSAWHVNSDGFRYDEITKEKPRDTYRIFVTGGSTVFDEWQSYETTLVKQLEDLLRKQYPDRKIQVINAGYLRYTSEHTLILYASKLADYDPDLIIVWQGFNDMIYSCTPPVPDNRKLPA